VFQGRYSDVSDRGEIGGRKRLHLCLELRRECAREKEYSKISQMNEIMSEYEWRGGI
jgi:hypothetical protein